jgi:hypothetical protein
MTNQPATEDRKEVAVRPAQPLMAGAELAAILPRSLEDAFRLGTAIARADLAPKTLNTAEKCTVAILTGAELGFPPMQAIRAFYMVNNQLTIWGDAIPALLYAHRFKIKEWLANESDAYPDDMTAHCRVTRPDGEEIERTFSVFQAKEAKLWSKDGPWQTAKRRMLQMRARGFACRDGAADVLRGTSIAEEVRDFEVLPARDNGRQTSGLAARLNAPKAEAESAKAAGVAEEGPELVQAVTALVTALRHAETGADIADILRGDEKWIEALDDENRQWVEETARLRVEELRQSVVGDEVEAEVEDPQPDPSESAAHTAEADSATPDSATDASEVSAEEASGQPAQSEATSAGEIDKPQANEEDAFPGDRPADEGEAHRTPEAEAIQEETKSGNGAEAPVVEWREIIMRAPDWPTIARQIYDLIESGEFQAFDAGDQKRTLSLAYNRAAVEKMKVNPEHDPMYFMAWAQQAAPADVRKSFRALARTRTYLELEDPIADAVVDIRNASAPDE